MFVWNFFIIMVVFFFFCVGKLIEECDLWSSVVYIFFLKVIDKYLLNIVKKLYFCEKVWVKLS